MSIRVKVASTPVELNHVYQLRYQVYVEEYAYMQANPQRIIMDMFDGMPDSYNIIAYDGETPVGTIRVVIDGALQLPADQMYDFNQYRSQLILQNHEQNLPPPLLANSGMFAIDANWRNRRDLFRALFKLSCDIGEARGVTDIITTANIETLAIYKRMGLKALGAQVRHEHISVSMVPMHCTMQQITQWAFGGPRAHTKLTELFSESFEYLLVSAGTPIFNASEENAEEAYLISSGAISIAMDRADQQQHFDLATLTAGELFGESCLFDEQGRTVNAAAIVNTDLLVLKKQDFWQKVNKDPSYMKTILKVMEQKLRDVGRRALIYAHASQQERLEFFLEQLSKTAKPMLKKPHQRVVRMGGHAFSVISGVERDESQAFLEQQALTGSIGLTDKSIIFYSEAR
ncbi:N-acyl amino acid synthase FeeM domain-containing protein [Pseudoalteromonas obscura]|uniref:Cyclic nucleotide-binding domain-containing protein n=1 Tax=Pseudoalteromonas obscura TaxID=3048491 RepID=A0ABT7EDX9_9GAMM|nr:cyclic nucleotide-binding domain-containing protein [Pseudoalteromonas sp. P94(2023)]MDK2593483.1 cyclic nucleotide-binding domain-containing protein [Pseudoalteromonas sp. P94(2023)]